MVREIRGVLSLAPPAAGLARADRQDGGGRGDGRGGARGAARGPPGVRRGGGAARRAPPAQPPRRGARARDACACGGRWRRRCRTIPAVQELLDEVVARRLDPATAARRVLEREGVTRTEAGYAPDMPSPDAPLQGTCACGAVRFQVTAPFDTAGHCHCHRCRRRSGAMWSINATLGADGFEVVPARRSCARGGRPTGSRSRSARSAAATCSAATPGRAARSACASGRVDGDPGVEPQWRQWLESAPGLVRPIPDDGLPRFPRSRHDA